MIPRHLVDECSVKGIMIGGTWPDRELVGLEQRVCLDRCALAVKKHREERLVVSDYFLLLRVSLVCAYIPWLQQLEMYVWWWSVYHRYEAAHLIDLCGWLIVALFATSPDRCGVLRTWSICKRMMVVLFTIQEMKYDYDGIEYIRWNTFNGCEGVGYFKHQ